MADYPDWTLPIVILLQYAGIWLQPDWQAYLDADKNLSGGIAGGVNGWQAAVSYVVPAGKTFYGIAFSYDVPVAVPAVTSARLRDVTDNVVFGYISNNNPTAGFTGAADMPLPKPAKVPAGHTVAVECYVTVAFVPGSVEAALLGYEI